MNSKGRVFPLGHLLGHVTLASDSALLPRATTGPQKPSRHTGPQPPGGMRLHLWLCILVLPRAKSVTWAAVSNTRAFAGVLAAGVNTRNVASLARRTHAALHSACLALTPKRPAHPLLAVAAQRSDCAVQICACSQLVPTCHTPCLTELLQSAVAAYP